MFLSNMRILVTVWLGLACALSSMAQSTPPSPGDHPGDTNTSDHAVSGYTPDDKHLLEPGDVISFQIMEDKKPAISMVVTDSGEVNFPYIRRVPVAGKTCRKLAEELKVMLEQDYYKHATVVVGLDMLNRTKVEKVEKVIGRVRIWGEVRTQGSVDILSGHNLTISEALLKMGGLTDSADKKKVSVFRNSGHGSSKVIYVNVHDIMDRGKIEKDLTLEPDDIIIVAIRLIRF
jgi:polysaccharide export outer membrane protein